MGRLLLLLFLCQFASSVKHSLKFFFCQTSGVQNIPEFVVVGLVDGVQKSYYDSRTERPEPKTEWMKKLMKDDPQHLEWYTARSLHVQHLFKHYIENLRKRFNQTEVLPSVSLLQKSLSSPVSCHATGFYPDRGLMFWRKDGEELHEGVDPGEILPNNDGTFQMSIDLNVSSVTPEDWERYDCVFQLFGVNEDITTKLDKTLIRTNWGKPAHIIPTAVVLAIVLIAAVAAVAVVAYKRKKAPANASEQSETLNPQT
ncbi:major histocompatibility complex class I-related gene protein-like isoform X2 [Pundamilia nyererei]|uniref:Major histocompatibility complex class I-related gene protein-like isoform X2 n=1 Tax=Pundamilia nyererei TaxID=303518 RepID=A0A9Y3S4J1_9CICH|nr:PREDICTED: major histocompatibility complex class I-related gene protein-like isoform X2 [Pundamilia nyererei]